MTNASMRFRAKINTPGTYSFDVEVYNVNTGNTLCETTANFTVQAGSELTTDIGTKKFVVGVPTEFTFSTKANGHKGVKVVGTSNFNKPDAIETLEYFEPNTQTWINMNQDPSDFGAAAGFPMSDATSKFRVTFKQAGTYSFSASMKKVDGGKILCATNVEFTVTDPAIAAGSTMPSTGDSSSMMLWSMLAVMSIVGMMMVLRKKSEA